MKSVLVAAAVMGGLGLLFGTILAVAYRFARMSRRAFLGTSTAAAPVQAPNAIPANSACLPTPLAHCLSHTGAAGRRRWQRDAPRSRTSAPHTRG